MSDKEKPLPKPPVPPFGRKGRTEQAEGETPLIADRIALAAAGGKLEEFVKSEIPDSDQARKLVSLMMGMTGMASMDMGQPCGGGKPSSEPTPEASSAMPPEDVVEAVHAGDVKGLMGLLERERRKRSPEEEITEESQTPAGEKATVEKDTIDLLIKIASENDVSPDWIVLRALRLYIREYERTGRL